MAASPKRKRGLPASPRKKREELSPGYRDHLDRVERRERHAAMLAREGCPCRACAKKLEPGTREHFRAWAYGLTLDSGKRWRIEEWQLDFVEDVFSGIPEAWLVVPEENAKSTLVAALGLYHLQHTEGARVAAAASSRDQAGIIFERCEGFVYRSDLEDVFRCHEGMRRVVCAKTHSRLQIFASDEKTGDGIIPTLCILEELHRHRSLTLYRTWQGKLGKRGAQIVAISTAGEPGSEFEKVREEIRQSGERSGEGPFLRVATKRVILHDWSVPDGADLEDLKVVAEANPLKAVTVKRLREKRESPVWNLEHWARFVCNRATRSGSTAISEAEWFAAASEERIPEGEPVWAGLDVGWKYDSTALVPLWWEDAEFQLFGRALELVPPQDGRMLHPDEIKRAVIELHSRNPIIALAMDTSRAEDIAAWLADELEIEVIDRGQTHSFAVRDYEAFMRGLRGGTLHHSGDKVLTRHALNAVARILPLGDVRFDRPAASRLGGGAAQESRVIDALTAASMAYQLAWAEEGEDSWGVMVIGGEEDEEDDEALLEESDYEEAPF